MSKKGRSEEEEPSFRVTDRRRVSPEGPQGPSQAPEPQSERTSEPSPPPSLEPPIHEKEEQEFILLPVPDLVRIFIAELQTRALVHMGLIPNPATRLVATDLSQARLAIDSVAALIEQLSPSAPPAEREELQKVLTNLRLNFVQQGGGKHRSP